MNDGDIYFWRYRDDVAVSGNPYHCKSRKAVVIGGRLVDTFWGAASDGYVVDPERAVLDFKGNTDDLRKIDEWEARYYDADDVIDMRHSNNSLAWVYVKAYARRSSAAMLDYINSIREASKSEIRMAEFRLSRLDEMEARVMSGDLDSVII